MRGLQEESLIDGQRYTLSIMFGRIHHATVVNDMPMTAEIGVFMNGCLMPIPHDNEPSPTDFPDDFYTEDTVAGWVQAPRVLWIMEMFCKAKSHEDILKMIAEIVEHKV